MAKTPHESPFFSSSSSSRRHFQLWTRKKEEDRNFTINPTKAPSCNDKKEEQQQNHFWKQSISMVPVLKLLTALNLNHAGNSRGNKVTGTLFGCRRGHVHLAFQEGGPKSTPSLLIELATQTTALVREMAAGLVRIALECDKKKGGPRLTEEPLWRTYCNGRKCGFAMRRDCGPAEWKVLRTVEPVTMGAGVLPGSVTGVQGELMYLRAQFERVVGSRDSEAYYMLSPDEGAGGPELSIYLLRV